jgi:TonB family protein
MPHGSQHYFLERARFERRLSLVTSGVSLLLVALQAALLIPALRRGLDEAVLRRLPGVHRFGFEGPDQYVRRIFLETSGPPGPDPGRPTMVWRSLRAAKGGRPDQQASPDPNARPDTRPPGVGAGESVADLVARARVIYGGSAPVMQSEDLVIERLVRPEYPQEARDRDIEGRVALVALVDTTGAVARVDLMSSTGEPLLENASRAAVRQCRFRPYREGGRVTEVYAVFRFVFRIY